MKKRICFALGIFLLVACSAFAQKQGGTLNGPVITTAFVENFNPFTHDANRNPARGFIYDMLVVYNVRQNTVEYRLAIGFEYSEDLLSLTYHLREIDAGVFDCPLAQTAGPDFRRRDFL